MTNPPESGTPIGASTDTEAALKRILGSERFRKNASLRHLLEYLVTRTLRGEHGQIKETTVAMDVFGRARDFDSRLDNIVRVQAHRLRKLLTAYYEAEGAGERIRFSIPRGGYIPHIETAPDANGLEGGGDESLESEGLKTEAVLLPEIPVPVFVPPVVAPVVPQTEASRRKGDWRSLALGFVGGVVAVCAVLALLSLVRGREGRRMVGGSSRAEPLVSLWGPILNSRSRCVVSYSNPVFLAADHPPHPRILVPYTGLLSVPTGARLSVSPADLNLPENYFGENPVFSFSDGWTGVGEVAAMQRIASLLAPDVELQVMRSRALTYSDIRESNVIFLGSPWANDMQKKINVGPTPLMNDNSGNILNLKPEKGEAASFRAQVDGVTQQMTATYGLFSVLPGLAPGTKVFISAGVNTYGTQGAMEFMTSPAGVEQVIRRLGTGGSHSLPEYFQAVIRAEMIRGEPAQMSLIVARKVERRPRSTVQ